MFGRRGNAAQNGSQKVSGKHFPPDFIAGNFLLMVKEAYAETLPNGQLGIHCETVLSALGALAGFGCQIAVRELMIKQMGMPEPTVLHEVTMPGHPEVYYVGDQLNKPLFEVPASVLGYVGGAVSHLGGKVPDCAEIAVWVIHTMHTPEFGSLRVSPEHQPHQLPIDTLRTQWAGAWGLLHKQLYQPAYTGWYFGLAAHKFILEAKDSIDPTLAGQITMESAIAMAKVDPRSIGFQV